MNQPASYLALMFTLTALAACPANSQQFQASIEISPSLDSSQDGNERYWTEDQRANSASQLPLLDRAVVKPVRKPASAATTRKVLRAGRAPTIDTRGKLDRGLFSSEVTEGATALLGSAKALAGSASNDTQVVPTEPDPLPFNTSRIFPYATVKQYPLSAVGRLYFTDQRTRRNYICSASVIAPRIVLTAGHCVVKPSAGPTGRYFYTKFNFVPALSGIHAPFGTWTATRALVSTIWSKSDGSVPNAQDVGLLIMADQTIDGRNARIGDVTGTLGTVTDALLPNQLTILGYPGSFDRGQRMAVTQAGLGEAVDPNTAIYGSTFTGGSSGGPWLQNFGILADGQDPPIGATNAVVAVTSYGPAKGRPNYLGASNLMGRGQPGGFGDLFDAACGLAPGNC